MKQSLEHLDEMMNREVERPAGKHFVTKPHFEGQITFKDVVFKYPSTPYQDKALASVLADTPSVVMAGVL